jgi:hypothetical protein
MLESFYDEVVQQLRRDGSDVSRPCRLDLLLYLPTEEAARIAAKKVERLHFATEVVPGAKEGTWLCQATIVIIPESAPLDGVGAYFEQVAYELQGDFDGWQAEIVRA